MTGDAWGKAWNAVGAAMAASPKGLPLAIALGLALLFLMVLEGVHVTLFPRRTVKRLNARQSAGQMPKPDVPAALSPRPQTEAAPATNAPHRWRRPEPVRPRNLAGPLRRGRK